MKDYSFYKNELKETGKVTKVNQTLVSVTGLPGAMLEEIVLFETGEKGQVLTLTPSSVDCLVFSNKPILSGTAVVRTGTHLEVPVGQMLLGQTISPLGESLEEKTLSSDKTQPVFTLPAGISKRKRIHRASFTGVSAVDLLLPLGKGQRELIIGDRKSGKTNFILQSLLFQMKEGTIGIYAGIGKKKTDIKKVQEFFRKHGVQTKSIIVASSSDDPDGTIFLTPYTALAIAEYFKDQGKDVLVVLDDLTTHAKFYREIALMNNRFPGRNAYPGDIFSIHARLLERAGNFITERGEASITCLPVVETLQGDLSGFIQTNIMSMTDGHIFFDSELFALGRRPAVNPFLSVTRVGKQTQDTLQREITNSVIEFLAKLEKLQNFTHFGGELQQEARDLLTKGDQVLHFFNQPTDVIYDQYLQIFSFTLMWMEQWKSIDVLETHLKKARELYTTNAIFQEKVYTLVTESESLKGLHDAIEKDALLRKLS